MTQSIKVSVLAFLILILPNERAAWAQFGGNAVEGNGGNVNDFSAPALSVDEAQNLIAVDGSAEIRVKPTEIRMVLAAVSESKTANDCQTASAELIQRITSGWQKAGIAKDSIFEDFVSILPVYEFEESTWQKITVMKENLVRFRYQSNLHVRLIDHEQAREALKVAFENGVTDIVSFDYWSSELEAVKTEALQKAIAVARRKARIIFDPELFPKMPMLVNVTEAGRVLFPRDMYESYTNTIEQLVVGPYNWNNEVPKIMAARPRTTFYRGPVITGESLSTELPMKPEISVVAKVKLYFESPSERYGLEKAPAVPNEKTGTLK